MSEEPVELGVSEVREHNGMIEVDCWHYGYDEKLILKFPYCQLPKPDASFTASHGSVTDSKALQAALYVEGLIGNLMNGDKSAIKKMNVEALVILIQFARDKARQPSCNNGDRITEHINALGPQDESSLIAWMLRQLPGVDSLDAAKRLLTTTPKISRYSEDGRVYYTTSSQDPR